jgi:hypothetical protein
MAQADLVVANQSGAAFRADVNNQLQALGTLSSGLNEPSVTYAYMPWADTAAGLLKIRNAANNGWVTIGSLAEVGFGLLSRAGGTMTGALLQAAGTAAAPGLAVAGDADTGLYGKAANELGVAVAGALTAWFDANGVNLAGQDDVRFWDSDSSNYVGLQAPATVASNLVWTLPATDGGSEQALTTNGSGVLQWGGTTCRAWVNFNGTGTVSIRASYNVSSITDNGVGSYAVNLINALADANYSAVATTQPGGSVFSHFVIGLSKSSSIYAMLAGYVSSFTAGYTSVDVSDLSVAIFR